MRILLCLLILIISCDSPLKEKIILTDDEQWIDSIRVSNLRLDSLSGIKSQSNCSSWHKEGCIDTSLTEVYRLRWQRTFHPWAIFTVSNYNDTTFKLDARMFNIRAKDSLLIISRELTKKDWTF